jgi:hypothetical protein
VLITGEILTVLYFSYSNVFGWLISLHGLPGWALEGADIGVGAGLAMALAGIAPLVGGQDLSPKRSPRATSQPR